ncbi:MAG TPA: epoxide hydrolase N-terminal domain-containing protein [Bryobacteraceae bacterium]|jgi:hypothetical protein
MSTPEKESPAGHYTIDQLTHYRTELDGIGIHLVYERGKGPAPFPLVLSHGYPDSFYRFVKLIASCGDWFE